MSDVKAQVEDGETQLEDGESVSRAKEQVEVVEVAVDPALIAEAIQEEWPAIKAEFERLGATNVPEKASDAVDVEDLGAGFTGVEIAFAVLPALGMMAKDVWKQIILPRLKQRFGPNAVKESAKKPRARSAGPKKR